MSDVLAVAEHRDGELRDVSYELVTAGRELAAETGGTLHVAVIGGDVETFAENLNCEGVETIHTVDDGEAFNHDVYAQAVTALATDLDPQVILLPHTANGIDYGPAVATDLECETVSDAVDLRYDDHLEVTRELYNSKVETVFAVDAARALVTVRPAEWPPADDTGSAAVTEFDPEIDEAAVASTVVDYDVTVAGDIEIGAADFIVAVGRGIEDEENLELIEELCDATGATLAASRPVCDNQWLSKGRQVGQSGKDVSPDVYIAIGISGAVQHVAGMKNSETIIAINDDPSAPIFNIADYGIVDDLFDVVPELTEKFETARA